METAILILSKDEAIEFFGEFFGGEHHIPSKLKEFGYGWSIVMCGDLSTYDFNKLTRLVVMAHKYQYRVSIMNGGPRRLKIVLNRRDPNAEHQYQKHPNLDDLIKMCQDYNTKNLTN